MAAKKAVSARTKQREEARAERKAAAAESSARKPEPKRSYTLKDCMKLGRTANILFVAFIIICLIYYYSLAKHGKYIIPFEVVAYSVEAIGFVLFSVGVIWLDRLVRARGVMKVSLILYIIVEIVLMLFEFDLIPLIPYNGLSLPLIITHVLFSAAVSLTLLMLEPQNKRVQIIVTITTIIILAGMFLGIAGYRVYATILLNSFAYIFFFTAMLHQLHVEEVDIDCYGDRAESTGFSSTMFENVPTMVEIPKAKPLTLREKAKRAAEQLNPENQESVILTDKDESFEYEFGVDEDDDDDDEYEDDEYEDEEDGDGEA